MPNLADRFRIQSVQWRTQRWDQLSGLGSGDVLAAQLAPPRIVADIVLMPMYNAEAGQVQALIDALDGPMNSFYLWPPHRPFPQADPDGTALGASTVQIKSIGSNNKSLAFKGLPAGYVITTGDSMAWDFGSSPVRRAFHTATETVTTDGYGETAEFGVTPHLRPGTVADLTVTLKKPAAKVFIVPDSFRPGTASGRVTTGMSFQVMQRP